MKSGVCLESVKVVTFLKRLLRHAARYNGVFFNADICYYYYCYSITPD